MLCVTQLCCKISCQRDAYQAVQAFNLQRNFDNTDYFNFRCLLCVLYFFVFYCFYVDFHI